MPTVTQLSTRWLWAGFTYFNVFASSYIFESQMTPWPWHAKRTLQVWWHVVSDYFCNKSLKFLAGNRQKWTKPTALDPGKEWISWSDLTWPCQSVMAKKKLCMVQSLGWLNPESIHLVNRETRGCLETSGLRMETSECLVGCLCHLQTIFSRKLRGRFEHIFSTNACCYLVG